MNHDSEQEEKEYMVRVYIVKHFDVTVKALNEEEAQCEGENKALDECTWFYKGDCAVLDDATEVEEL